MNEALGIYITACFFGWVLLGIHASENRWGILRTLAGAAFLSTVLQLLWRAAS